MALGKHSSMRHGERSPPRHGRRQPAGCLEIDAAIGKGGSVFIAISVVYGWFPPAWGTYPRLLVRSGAPLIPCSCVTFVVENRGHDPECLPVLGRSIG